MITLKLGDCLEVMRSMESNSVDSVVCDPPYFLTNDSGSGFMGKEWDSLSVANAFAEALLKSLNPVWITGVESSVQGPASTKTKKTKKDLSLTALYVTPKFIGRNQQLSPITFSALQSVLTRAEVLALSKGLCPNLTTVFENQPDSVLYVLDHSFIQSCPNSIAHELALKLATNKICEDLKTLHSLTADQKIEDLIAEMTGKKFEKKSTEEISIAVKSVESIVAEERYNATTLSHIEWRKITRWIISLRFVRSAMGMFTEIPENIQILSERFHYNWAKECLRVLKPGGHLLAFSGTRTFHPLAKAVGLAGFEIRDQIQWLYGSGFPKSHDISKAIDKAAGAEREQGKELYFAKKALGVMNDDGWKPKPVCESKPSTPEAIQWQGWGTALKPANEPIVVARKPLEKGLTVAQNVLRYGTGALNIDASRIRNEAWEQERGHLNSHANRAAKTESQDPRETKESSATKSVEPISSAKESAELESTSKMATGCSHGQSQAEPSINLSEKLNSSIERSGKKTSEQFQKDLLCITKITTDSTTESKTSNSCSDQSTSVTTKENGKTDLISLQNTLSAPVSNVPQGRWPSNCIFDEEAAAMLDEQSGHLKGGGQNYSSNAESMFGTNKKFSPSKFAGDSGGASRFFYCAKASKSERNAGLEGMPLVKLQDFADGSKRKLVAQAESDKNPNLPRQNFHPTVKPIKLMSYLINLVTPPGGIVLEPFMGSGTTGVAAKLLGFKFIGIERDPEYFQIAQKRIENAGPEVKEPDPQMESPAPKGTVDA